MTEELFKEIKEKYNDDLKTSHSKMIKKKRLFNFISVIEIIIFLVGFFVIMIPFDEDKNISFVLYSFIVFVILFLVLLILQSSISKYSGIYNNKYYATVVKDLIGSVYTDVNCSLLDNYKFSHNFKESGFLYYDTDFIHSEWKAKYNDKTLTIYDVLLENEYKDSDGNKHYSVVFNGLFGVMDFDYDLKEKIYINQNGIINSKELEEVNMDSVIFNSKYSVYSTNKVFVMQLLTHDVMDEIIDISERYNINFEFRIFDNKIYYLVHNGNTFINDSKESINKKELTNDYNNISIFKEVYEVISKSIKDNNILD